MSTISVYAFEDNDDEPATEWTTMVYAEAEEYAKQYGYSIIEREYEYADSTLVADYRTKDAGQDDGLETHPGINDA